ncbi:uncharacterized protein LOC117792061 [Drosophila innubila]|uniref:uncharacterized protein LOC117792061 n=1 Tax=Drosophila innubila TaxID=198719 RepID=UPI00148CEF09|nr:uncharacterized protein LOC117792061 [Drosophila innubila]
MIAKVFLLALLVAVASSTPVSQDTSMVGYGEAVGMFLQAWKKIMPCGFPAENIPVLAPYTLDFDWFQYLYEPTKVLGNVSDIRISGLDGFQIMSSSYNASTMRRTFDVMYPEIQVVGSLALDGTFSLGGLPLPVYHDFLLNLKLTDLRFVGEYTFAQSLSNANGLRISDFDLKYYIGDVKANNWDKYMDIAANKYLNDFIGSFSLLFSEETQPAVNPLFAKYWLPTINDLLSNLDITQLTNFFVMQAEIWNNAGCAVKA